MTTPTPPGQVPFGATLSVRMAQAAQEAVVVLGFRLGTLPDISQAMAVAARDAFWTAFRPVISTTVTVTGATLRKLDGGNAVPIDVGPPASNPSGAATGATVAAASTLIKWQTGTGGRTGKGRTFLPGVSSGAVQPQNGRLWEATHVTAVTNAINAYLTNAVFTAEDLVPAVLSRKDQVARPIVSGALAPVPGIQRRRMR